jgi:hypothetical protein
MLAWSRSLGLALVLHLLIFVLFRFTWQGSPKDFTVDFTALGAILRSYDVTPFLESSTPDAQTNEISLASDAERRQEMWFQGIQFDKPETRHETGPLGDEKLIRFSGARVNLDEDNNADHDDIPAASLMDLRLEHP